MNYVEKIRRYGFFYKSCLGVCAVPMCSNFEIYSCSFHQRLLLILRSILEVGFERVLLASIGIVATEIAAKHPIGTQVNLPKGQYHNQHTYVQGE